MPTRIWALSSALILTIAGASGFAQTAPNSAPASPSPDASQASAPAAKIGPMLQPALDEVQRTIGALNTGRWKTRGDVKSATDRYTASIQRDIVETLPGLITQADNGSGFVMSTFNVYRNIDALYDVLLRVSQTAAAGAPENEASAVEASLEHLESARKQLGEVISTQVQERDAEVVKLQTALKAATIAPPPPAKAAVVDDGPDTAAAKPKPHKKKKPATPPAPASSGTTPAAPQSN